MTRFHKMHGLGNDFVIVDARDQHVDIDAFVTRADRRTGIGYDQLILLTHSDNADLGMAIYNADGSTAGMCGNAARCVAALEAQRSGKTTLSIDVNGRIVRADNITMNSARVDMGAPDLNGMAALHPDLPDAELIGMGNPHAVFFVQDMDRLDTAVLGPAIEHHPIFPDRTNVEFCAPENGTIRVVVWERGAGFTQACGSGACAVGVAAIRQNRAQSPVTTRFPGGDLTIEWDAQEHGSVLMTGPVAYVFEGSI